jgi:tRNA (cytidine32/uridine32-2'-O)-methyltransferase
MSDPKSSSAAKNSPLQHIRIVMVNTFHPGNIGAVARAMKNMGVYELVLVDPLEFPHDEATSRAAGAVDILENARVVATVEEALEGCSLVVATSARRRGFAWPMQSARAAMQQAYSEASSGAKIAIMFGPERSGLPSETLRLANMHVYIPANPEYDVLNVASAAQTLCYELWVTHSEGALPEQADKAEYPSHDAVEHFYGHLEEVLNHTGFINPKHAGDIMVKLRRLFTKARPEVGELKILRGVLASIQKPKI